MKRHLIEDEWYPVLTIEKVREGSNMPVIEIPDDLVKEYNRVDKAFNKVQEKLTVLYNTALSDKWSTKDEQ